MSFARAARIGYVVVVGILAGCLDAGAPPMGRHLVTGRDEDSVELVAGAAGAASRIVFSHAQTESSPAFSPAFFPTTRLSTIEDPGPGGGATKPRVFLEHTVGAPQTMSNGFCTPAGCKPPVDARGRLYLDRLPLQADQDGSGEELVRVDPSSGEQHSFGNVHAFDISSSGTRIMVETMFGAAAVFDLDDSSTSSSVTGQAPAFVGDDLFFVASDGTFMHLPPATTAPIPLVAAVNRFETFATERGGLIVLRRLMPGAASDAPSSLFDPMALVETDLPSVTAAAQTYLPSPDGRYLVSEGFASTSLSIAAHLTIFDRDTAGETVHELPSQQSVRPPVWRPDHDEVWFIANDQAWRWQPDQEAIPVNSGALSPFVLSDFVAASPQEVSDTAGSSPVFTPDGRFRLVAAGDFGKPSVYLQSADDDTAPPLRLNPDGTGLHGLWPLVDGRLLVEAWINDGRRNDIYLVDPAAGVTRSVASTGHVLATGRDRFLALQHVVLADGSGDLTSIDYATGTETLIAENVHSVAVDSSPVPDDALAPGTRVVYLVRNRIASPYDGCWAIDLP